jgi:hypothetical protein
VLPWTSPLPSSLTAAAATRSTPLSPHLAFTPSLPPGCSGPAPSRVKVATILPLSAGDAQKNEVARLAVNAFNVCLAMENPK